MRDLLRRLLRTPQGTLGLMVVGLILLVAVCGPWLAPYGPDTMAPRLRYRPPNADFLLGTDQYGRDILSRLLYGARSTVDRKSTRLNSSHRSLSRMPSSA